MFMEKFYLFPSLCFGVEEPVHNGIRNRYVFFSIEADPWLQMLCLYLPTVDLGCSVLHSFSCN